DDCYIILRILWWFDDCYIILRTLWWFDDCYIILRTLWWFDDCYIIRGLCDSLRRKDKWVDERHVQGVPGFNYLRCTCLNNHKRGNRRAPKCSPIPMAQPNILHIG